jgi:hypothetical protein
MPIRPKLPTEVRLVGVAPGERPQGEAGAYAPRDANVSVQIEGDPDQLFNVDGLQIYDLEPVTDLPPGHTGPPPMELVPGPSVVGPGPIEADAGEAVIAKISFLAPVPAFPIQDVFQATAVMTGDTWPRAVQVALTASVMHVRVDVLTPTVQITQGKEAKIKVLLTSEAGPDTTVDFFSVTAPAGVLMEEISIGLARGDVIERELTLSALPDALLGSSELEGVEFTAFDGVQVGDIDHKVTVEVLPSFHAPPPDSDPRFAALVAGTTQRICQLTGGGDPSGLDHVNDTTQFALLGTDLGTSFDHIQDGEWRTYFFFGDTEFGDTVFDQGDSAGDAIAYTTDPDPEPEGGPQGLHLQFIMGDNQWRRLVIPGISSEAFEVPSGGFSHAGRLFVFATTDHEHIDVPGTDGTDFMLSSVLASAPDAHQDFSLEYFVEKKGTYDLARFINISPFKVANETLAGVLPENAQASGEGLLLVGSGDYRMSNAFLAYVPLLPGQRPELSEWRFFGGMFFSSPGDPEGGVPIWLTQEEKENTLPIVSDPQLGELSFCWNPFLQRWLLVYQAGYRGIGGIWLRSARWPWGPWSEPQLLFDNEQGHLLRDPFIDPGGAAYAPYIISRYNKWDSLSQQATIYYTMSTWKPYQVMLIKSQLQLVSK